MKVQPFLADFAQVEGGKVGALGLGWTTCGTPAPPFAFVIFIDFELHELRDEFLVTINLLGSDDQPVTLPGPSGPVPVSFQFKTALKLHDQAATDLSIRLPIALNVQGSLPLELGKYRWRILLKEFEADAGYAAFEVLSKVTPTVSGSGPVLQHPDL